METPRFNQKVKYFFRMEERSKKYTPSTLLYYIYRVQSLSLINIYEPLCLLGEKM